MAQLTTAQVADRLGIAPVTWRAYVSRGRAPQATARLDARTPVWEESVIDRWVAERSGKQPSAAPADER